MEGHWKYLGGGLKSQNFKAKYPHEAKLEFLGGEKCTKQKTLHGGVSKFSGTTQSGP